MLRDPYTVEGVSVMDTKCIINKRVYQSKKEWAFTLSVQEAQALMVYTLSRAYGDTSRNCNLLTSKFNLLQLLNQPHFFQLKQWDIFFHFLVRSRREQPFYGSWKIVQQPDILMLPCTIPTNRS